MLFFSSFKVYLVLEGVELPEPDERPEEEPDELPELPEELLLDGAEYDGLECVSDLFGEGLVR